MSNLTLTKAELTRLLSAFAWISFGIFALIAFIQFETLQKDYWLGLRYMSYGIAAASAALFFHYLGLEMVVGRPSNAALCSARSLGWTLTVGFQERTSGCLLSS